MRCPRCGKTTTVAKQVERSDGNVARVRVCEAAECAEVQTVEVPAAVLSIFGEKAMVAAMARFRRGAARRAMAAKRREVVRQLTGKRPAAEIARFLNITEARVRQLAAELRDSDALPAPQTITNRLDG